jgi:hypothetical protein
MAEPLKYFIERTTPIGRLARLHRHRQLRKKLRKWEQSGRLGPMPNLGKQQVVIEYIKKFSPEVFIETGTYKGKMVYAVMPHIRRIYSIELDPTHARNAQLRFSGHPNIRIIQGESGAALAELMPNINQSCLFWLDAHYSGGSTARGERNTPIKSELQTILKHQRADEHVILIDDAACFVGENDYPTLEELKNIILIARPDWVFHVQNHIIRAHRPQNGAQNNQ